MNDHPAAGQDVPTKQQWIIDVLARETAMPVDVVKDIYVIEHSKLEQAARVKNFVSVLALRQTRLVLSQTSTK